MGWPTGLEPATTRATVWGSTIELRPPIQRGNLGFRRQAVKCYVLPRKKSCQQMSMDTGRLEKRLWAAAGKCRMAKAERRIRITWPVHPVQNSVPSAAHLQAPLGERPAGSRQAHGLIPTILDPIAGTSAPLASLNAFSPKFTVTVTPLANFVSCTSRFGVRNR